MYAIRFEVHIKQMRRGNPLWTWEEFARWALQYAANAKHLNILEGPYPSLLPLEEVHWSGNPMYKSKNIKKRRRKSKPVDVQNLELDQEIHSINLEDGVLENGRIDDIASNQEGESSSGYTLITNPFRVKKCSLCGRDGHEKKRCFDLKKKKNPL